MKNGSRIFTTFLACVCTAMIANGTSQLIEQRLPEDMNPTTRIIAAVFLYIIFLGSIVYVGKKAIKYDALKEQQKEK